MNTSKGKLLLSGTSMLFDDFFNRSVLYLTEYNDKNAIAFILNKPIGKNVQELISGVKCEFDVYYGGPVEKECLYYIHRIPELIPNSEEVSNGIYWGGNFNDVKDKLNKKLISSDQIRFFLGYSGWEGDQLNKEILKKSWISVENTHTNIFNINHLDFWKNEIELLGDEYKIWINAPENPSLN
ncbi:MAG: YqgE/AlgH family protein [Flavobacteriaceae bacterium]|nr:YqgE/AlgH family protein [Flavobacteriaceae bacterium]